MNDDFVWERLGDVNSGRENLGAEMPVLVYRLLQFTMKDILESKYGTEAADDVMRQAGYRAGLAFSKNVLKKCDNISDFFEELRQQLKDLKIGILRLEKSDVEKLDFTLTVSEDLDCSGLPVTGDTVCVYDEGFIAALFHNFTGKDFVVRETDCWATGARTCRFSAKVL